MTPFTYNPGPAGCAPSHLHSSARPEARAIQSRLVQSALSFAHFWRSVHLATGPSAEIEEHLRTVQQSLSDIPTSLVDLHGSRFERPETGSSLSFAEIYDDGFLVIAMMDLPEGFVFEFHDHPHMIVLSKVLTGSLAIEYLDLENQKEFYREAPKVGDCAWATPAGEVLLKPGETAAVHPETRNLHRLIAKERTVILDVLFNHYDDKRVCSYFKVIQRRDDGAVRLRVFEQA